MLLVSFQILVQTRSLELDNNHGFLDGFGRAVLLPIRWFSFLVISIPKACSGSIVFN